MDDCMEYVNMLETHSSTSAVVQAAEYISPFHGGKIKCVLTTFTL